LRKNLPELALQDRLAVAAADVRDGVGAEVLLARGPCTCDGHFTLREVCSKRGEPLRDSRNSRAREKPAATAARLTSSEFVR
jgi:hypothetical protein